MDNSIQSEINNQTDEYFENLTECSASNLQRLDKEFVDMEKHYQRSAMNIINLPPDVAVQWKKEETSKHYEDVAFLIKEFTRLEYTPPPMFKTTINKLLEKDIEKIDSRDLIRDMELKSKKLLRLREITKLPSYKKETDESSIVPFNQRFHDIDPEALDSMLDFYKDYFEFIVNRMLRELYPKYVKEYSAGSNQILDTLINKITKSKKLSNYQLIEFFKKAWIGSSISNYLEYFKPEIRNAIAHDLDHDNVDIDFTEGKITFTSGKFKLEVSIGEFIAKYWGFVTNFYHLITQFALRSRAELKIEKQLVKALKSEIETESKDKKNKPMLIKDYLASSDLKPFILMHNSFVKTLNNPAQFDQIIDDITRFLLDQSSEKKLSNIIPNLIRYILSKYPINKPKDFRKAVSQKYLKYVKAGLFKDDSDFFREYLKSLE